jgi:amino acid adenylation domain-containing protein
MSMRSFDSENWATRVVQPQGERCQDASWPLPDEFPWQKCAHHLFEAQAECAPDAVAVIFKEQWLTYRELNARANQFAHRLRELGVQPDTLVGLCVEPSLELAIGVLGILKAGGAYVPLDPAYPTDRLATMLTDAQPHVIATQRHLASHVSNSSQPVIFLENSAAPASTNGPGEKQNPVCGVAPDHLAYVVFTSGSTGKPKGVLISHRSLVNHSAATASYYDLKPSDRVLQFASFSFDVAAEEIFPTWRGGATVIFWPEAFRAVPIRTFLAFVEQQGITVVNLPTPYWEEWVLQLGQTDIPPSLRLVIVGSEKVPSEMFSRWQKKVGDRVRWCNAYGPSEATITATIYEPNLNGGVGAADSVPIGKPIANTEVYVLDENLKPLPAGVPGELHIGGMGLARGYLNRPDLTAARFIRNPFSHEKKSRLYKTGDLVRTLADGNLEFLARIDDQVKIRGYRIELGEIEAVFRQHPAIGNAVVVVRNNAANEKSLLAYLVTRTNPDPSPAELREFLRSQLPDYMIPAGFVFMERLPLMLNGKVDRAALPTAEPWRRDMSSDEIALPRDSLEAELGQIWENILAVKPIGIRDNFFHLGGHSLLVLRLIAEIERTLSIDLPLSVIQQAPTIEQLALILRQKRAGPGHRSVLFASQTGGSKPAVFFYGGSVQLARYLGADQPSYMLEYHGLDGWRAPATIEEMADQSVAAIRAIQPHGPYFLGGYSFGGLVIYEVAQQLRQKGETIAMLVLIDPCLPNVQPPGETGDPPPPAGPCKEFLYHCRNLVRLGPKEKLAYIAVRVSARARMLKQFVRLKICELYLNRGYRVPAFLRMFYFMQLSAKAIERYVPQPYSERFAVLRRPESGSGEEWRHLAADKVEFDEVDAEHLDIIQEPYVQILAEKLRRFLDSAQRTLVDQEPSGLFATSLVPASSTVSPEVSPGASPKAAIR